MHTRHVITAAAVLFLLNPSILAESPKPASAWTQWGGPDRNFIIETTGLADTWPEDGPARRWHRELGDGYSCILVEDGVLYTMYRTEADEFTVALDAKTGRIVWKHKQHSPVTPQMAEFGPGPHSTPLIVGDRLYSIGSNAVMHCFDKKTGDVHWECDMIAAFGGAVPGYGYACSPIAYNGTLILCLPCMPGHEEPLAALDQKTGKVVWKNEPRADESAQRRTAYSSPLVINVSGQDQVVYFALHRIVGYDPIKGTELWNLPYANPQGVNATTPVWNGKDTLFVSAAYGVGARAIRLTRDGDTTKAEELWHSRKMRMHHGNAILVGDHVYGSTGDFGPAFFMAINLKTGKPVWRKRGFAKATCVLGGGKMIVLDEDGNLALTTATPDGLEVHARCKLAERYAWATPTLVGQTLYLRDRQHIMALDLR